MAKRPEEIAGVADVDCSGKWALVTGSTSGIGRATALALGRLGANVVVHGRDPEAGADLVEELSATGAEARFVRADFADLDAVGDLAETVRAETGGLELLFDNAGGHFREGRLTDLGVEYTFHVNHLAGYFLTAELLDHLSEPGRVVTTASHAHHGPDLDLDRVRDVDDYSASWAYGHSKLANVLFASELARRLDAHDRSITSNSVHPGTIPGSKFGRFLPGPIYRAGRLLDAVPGVTSVAEGAAELLFAGVSPRTADVSGRYFAGMGTETPSAAARDPTAARRLWEYSASVLGIDDPLPATGAHATGSSDE